MSSFLAVFDRQSSQGVHLHRLPRVLLIAVLVVSVVSIVQLIQASGVASVGYDLQRLEETRDQWREQNNQLEAEIARLSSLDRVDREARSRLKMVPAGSPLFVTVDRVPTQSLPSAAELEESRFGRGTIELRRSDGIQAFLDWIASVGEMGDRP